MRIIGVAICRQHHFVCLAVRSRLSMFLVSLLPPARSLSSFASSIENEMDDTSLASNAGPRRVGRTDLQESQLETDALNVSVPVHHHRRPAFFHPRCLPALLPLCCKRSHHGPRSSLSWSPIDGAVFRLAKAGLQHSMQGSQAGSRPASLGASHSISR